MNHSDLYARVLDHADALTDGLASETRDLDSFLLALIQLILEREIPCDLVTIEALRDFAIADGFGE